MRLYSAACLLLVSCALLGAMASPQSAERRTWRRSILRVVQVEQLCPGGPRSYRLAGERDSLALVVYGAQRFALGETVEVHR